MFDHSATSTAQFDDAAPGKVWHGFAVQLPDLLQKLRPAPDPGQVFAQLAQLLTGSVCDEAAAEVLTGERLARWHQHPPLTADIGEAAAAPQDDGPSNGSGTFSINVHIGGLPPGDDDWTSQDDYVAVLTLSWHHYRPTASDIATLKLAGRSAAQLVHRSQQAELLQAQQEHLRTLMNRQPHHGRPAC